MVALLVPLDPTGCVSSSVAPPAQPPTAELPLAAADVHEPHDGLDTLEWSDGWGNVTDSEPQRRPSPASSGGHATVQRAVPAVIADEVPSSEMEELLTAASADRASEDRPSTQPRPPFPTGQQPVAAEPPAIPANATGKQKPVASPPRPPKSVADSAGSTEPAHYSSRGGSNERAPDVPEDMDAILSELLGEDSGPPSRTEPHWYLEVFDATWEKTQLAPSPRRLAQICGFLESAWRVPKGARILDIGCAQGHHLLELARRGYDMVGVDKALSLLERGLHEAQRQELDAKFVLGDMRELTFENVFDGAYCIGSTFGYFDEATDVDVMRRIARALRPGATVVFEQLNRDWTIQVVPRRSWREVGSWTVMDDLSFDAAHSRLRIERSLLNEQQEPSEQQISMRLYAAHEWRALFEAAGLELVDVSGHWCHRGAFFGALQRQLIAVGRRP